MKYWQQLQDPRWQKKRLEILTRANFACEFCGDTPEGEALEIHHKYYKKGLMAWDYPDSSLACVCHGCHEEVAEVERLLLEAISPRDCLNTRELACEISRCYENGIGLRQVVIAVTQMVESKILYDKEKV